MSKIAVVYATLGRPEILRQSVASLDSQSRPPDLVVVSVTKSIDVGDAALRAAPLKVVFGEIGCAHQRNTGLKALPADIDIVIFFDDDFIPSRYWLERAEQIFAAHPDVGSLTGQVLRDGVKGPGISFAEGAGLVNAADQAGAAPSHSWIFEQAKSPYGCNMAFRGSAITGLEFDTRMVLYGWQEDRDFGARVVARQWKAVGCDALQGVHLGVKGGRVSGIRFGYSQMVNPWYMIGKGTMRRTDAGVLMARNFLSNAAGALVSEPHIDRRGRLRGNLLGLRDIVCGGWRPERPVEL